MDRLAPDGPYLRNAYFWLPADQVVNDGGRPARLVARPCEPLSCDTRQPGVRLSCARPVYPASAGRSKPEAAQAKAQGQLLFTVGVGNDLDHRALAGMASQADFLA